MCCHANETQKESLVLNGYSKQLMIPVSVKETLLRRKNNFGKISLRSTGSGWTTVFPTGWLGQGLHERIVFIADAGILT